ncbi:hypothetical protein BGZ72_000207 [Mortierella alpina]|nr:hypothetical protein BGZ72_000207 [Mortierella alpina]
MSSSTSSSLRSPQQYKSHPSSAYSSDEISITAPQRPPRSNRQRSESTSSPNMPGAHYYQQHQHNYLNPQHQQQYEQYMSSSPPSLKPSPRSTSSSYAISTYSSQPSSPMSFQLPPSALSSTKEEPHHRTGSVSLHPLNGHSGKSHSLMHSNPIQIPVTSSSSLSPASSTYRTPRLSPGISGSGSGGLFMTAMPPLSLPEAFLEEQADYEEYYSDVGIQEQQHAYQSAPLHIRHSSLHQQSFDYPTSGILNRHAQQLQHPPQQPAGSTFLPSPHMTPTTSPLSGEFPSLSLGKCWREVIPVQEAGRQRSVRS